MKRNLFFLSLLIALLALGFAACDSNGDSGTTPGGNVNVVGFWDGTASIGGVTAPVTVQFTEGGMYILTAVLEGTTTPVAGGNYRVSGNIITFDGLGTLSSTATVTGNSFTAMLPDNTGGTFPVTFTRR